MNTDILKERYRRSNETENFILETVIDNAPNLVIYDKHNTTGNIKTRIKITQGKNRLFINAQNDNLTEKGYNRIVEFLFVNAKNQWHWIDAKHANSNTNICKAMYGEFQQVKRYQGTVIFFHAGKGYTATTMADYNKYLKEQRLTDKIKPIADIEKLKSIFN